MGIFGDIIFHTHLRSAPVLLTLTNLFNLQIFSLRNCLRIFVSVLAEGRKKVVSYEEIHLVREIRVENKIYISLPDVRGTKVMD